MNFVNHCISVISIFILISCLASTDEEEVRSAIAEAHYYLDSSNCSKAKSVLDDVGQQKNNADYVSVYASSIACVAGYKDIEVALNNLTSIDTSDQSTGVGFISSFAGFPSSSEIAPDQASYSKIFEAIQYILEADSASPSTVNRLSKYGNSDGNDLSMQALIMTTVAFGKWFAYYGNADASGTKGAGANGAGHSCVFSYTQADAVNYINAINPSGCSATGSEGSDDLETPVSTTVIQRRMCEGLVMFNNMVDILSNINLSSSSSLGQLSSMSTLFTNVISGAETAETTFNTEGAYANSVSTLKNVRGLAECEALDLNRIQKFYAILLEVLY